jgi:general secretion pathway protein A
MYESFYGLRERPFDLTPNPRFLFLTDVQREALSTLRYGLGGPRGLTLLLGEAGTGKTTLVRTVLAEISGGQAECVLISNPTLTRNEFYEALAEGFGFPAAAAASKTQFLGVLRQHLEERHAAGQLTALVLDEAQSLPYELIEEVRLLSNMESSTSKLLNVVLAGQPELADRFNEPRLRQMKQRIALRCTLRAFNGSETAAYIAGRLRIAGGSPVEIFTRKAVESVYAASLGVPRIINVICENALIGGFAAQLRPIPERIVDDVIADFDLGPGATVEDAPPLVPPVLDAPAPVADPAPTPQAVAAAADNSDHGSLFSFFGRKKRFSFF